MWRGGGGAKWIEDVDETALIATREMTGVAERYYRQTTSLLFTPTFLKIEVGQQNSMKESR